MSNKTILQTNNTNLASYTDRVDALIEAVNNLPEAGGVDLPELSNPASNDEVFLNKQVIDSEGNVLTGSFTIDTELDENEQLLADIKAALAGKAGGSLPALSNPATSSEILSGYEAIDEDGNVIVGEHECSGNGSLGGGSVNMNTCTVVVNADHITVELDYRIYEYIENENIKYNIKEARNKTETISNVRCDSVFTIIQAGYYEASITAGSILHEGFMSGAVFKTPSEAGVTMTINITTY